MTEFETAKALLRGKFSLVGRFRTNQPAAYGLLPSPIHTTAERFLGNGAGDKPGREALKQWLEANPK